MSLLSEIQRRRKDNRLIVGLALAVLLVWAAVSVLERRADDPATITRGLILFVLSYLGIAISLYPMIVPHHFTLWQAASSDRTQAFDLVGIRTVDLVLTGHSHDLERRTTGRNGAERSDLRSTGSDRQWSGQQ